MRSDVKVIIKVSLWTSSADRAVKEALELKKKYPDANICVRVSA